MEAKKITLKTKEETRVTEDLTCTFALLVA